MLSAEDVAEALQVSVDTVYRRWRKWGLKGYYVGRLLRFRERDINAWLESRAA
jgi:excisionase family DNA binding protein